MRKVAVGLFAASVLLCGSARTEDPEERTRKEALKHYRAGLAALNEQVWDEAEREFRAATQLDPLLVPAHCGLGQVYVSTKRYAEAVRAYSACRDAFHAEEANRLMDATASDQRLDDQIRALEDQVLVLRTGRVTTRDTSSTIQRLQDQIRELERRRYRKSTLPAPTPPAISLALGSAYFRTGAFADAEREYRAAVKVDPDFGEAHNNLAVVCMLTGRLEEADRELQLAEKSGFKVHPGLKEDLSNRKRQP